jgi:Phosphodiester glycosidase
VLDGRQPARIENLRSSAQLRAGGSVATILGINREPGSAEDCGVPGLAPTSAPRQGVICTGINDLVLFTPEFGAALPTGSGVQATIDPRGRVTALGTPGGSLPSGDSAVEAIGSDADWLASHLHVGDRATVSEQLRAPSGAPFPVDRQTSIVSAAPILLRGGRVAIDAVQEGAFDPRDLYDYSFSAERHARTIAGIDRDGRLILVTADGIPGVSEGLTLTEEAELMRTLGAVDAMNLDGGGSTTFVADGQIINDPSDSNGERPVGDSVQIVP